MKRGAFRSWWFRHGDYLRLHPGAGGNRSDTWHVIVRFWRLQLGARLMCHRGVSGILPDRWVLHPSIVYDRKRRG